jgi:hypothetical protein
MAGERGDLPIAHVNFFRHQRINDFEHGELKEIDKMATADDRENRLSLARAAPA